MRILIFKPDGIGDFILVTGSIHLLAKEAGEENLVICVTSQLEALARAQFPHATVIGLPIAGFRKRMNLFLANFISCFPAWRRIRGIPVDVAICFRSMRTYLHTFLFFSAKTSWFIALENLLVRSRRRSRVFVEWLTHLLRRPRVVGYPDAVTGVPTELEANRLLVSKLLDREVSVAEILPTLKAIFPVEGKFLVCSPLSSMESKDYPLSGWQEIFRLLTDKIGSQEILLVGSEAQMDRLRVIEDGLKAVGITNVRAFAPPGLQDFVDLIAGAGLVLTVDTAACHIATALDKPCLILFSGLHKGMFGPWQTSEKQIWLSPEFSEGKKGKWHTGINPERAAEEAKKIMKVEL